MKLTHRPSRTRINYTVLNELLKMIVGFVENIADALMPYFLDVSNPPLFSNSPLLPTV